MRRLTLLVSSLVTLPVVAVIVPQSPAFAEGETCANVPQLCECRFVQVSVPPYEPWVYVCPPPLP